MVGKITPVYVPKPVGILGYDGTDFYAVKVDVAGNLVLGSKLESGDQLTSYKAPLYNESYGAVSGANGYRDSGVVPANTVWHVTGLSAQDYTRATTQHAYAVYIGAHYFHLANPIAGYATGQLSYLLTDLWLASGAIIRVTFVGSQVADTVGLWVHGHTMTIV